MGTKKTPPPKTTPLERINSETPNGNSFSVVNTENESEVSFHMQVPGPYTEVSTDPRFGSEKPEMANALSPIPENAEEKTTKSQAQTTSRTLSEIHPPENIENLVPSATSTQQLLQAENKVTTRSSSSSDLKSQKNNNNKLSTQRLS